MGSRRTGRKIEMLWSCPSCNTKNILARYRECPNCGTPRSGITYVGDNPESSVLSEEDKKKFTGVPDWKCEYCGRMNKSDEESCVGCGSSKLESERDYFDINNEVQERHQVHSNNDSDIHIDSEIGIEHSETRELSSHNKRSFGVLELLYTFGFMILLTVGFFLFLRPVEDTISISSINWERNIEIEVEKTFSENGWSMPVGARLVYTREEWHHDEQVIDHYETKEVTKTRREVVDHYYTYEDNGDGTADEIEHDVYGDVEYTVKESVPVYKTVPVYRTKYYYEIDRYVHSRDIHTSGIGHTEYWGSYDLSYREREGTRTEKYTVTGINKSGKSKTYTADYEFWGSLNVGDRVNVIISAFGKIEPVKDK